MYGLGFLFYKFCFENIISIFLAYFAMEYLCYVSVTPFSFLSQLFFPKKKKKVCVCVCVGGGGGGNVRSLRLKNWLPLESTIIYKVVRSLHLKDMLFCESRSFFLLNIELECI